MKIKIQSIVIVIALLFLGSLTHVQGVSPAPDGCYPNFTTAEGCDALSLLSTGAGDTGLGWRSLSLDTSGNFNTGVGGGALALNNGDDNTAVGAAALLLNTSGGGNTAVGSNALLYNDNGSANTANGAFALFENTTGVVNVAIGYLALSNNDNGSGNVAIGEESMVSNVGGSDNTVVGAGAGNNIQVGSNNVYIGSGVDANGPFDESDTVRIGGAPNAFFPALHCFIGGIAAGGVTANVQVDATTGELLQVVSSARYKENIKPIDKASEAIFALKPVTFRYKEKLDTKGIRQFGLVAEEVARVNPDLVTLDREGRPDSVRYEGVNAMLLNEFLKEHRDFTEEQRKVVQQQNEIEALTRELKEQRAFIQKISDKVELKSSTPQVVADDRQSSEVANTELARSGSPTALGD
jgi:hypothetical protein